MAGSNRRKAKSNWERRQRKRASGCGSGECIMGFSSRTTAMRTICQSRSAAKKWPMTLRDGPLETTPYTEGVTLRRAAPQSIVS
ncbi:hypothetical protein Baya_10046 [Bagarius yarrelli]|uniref:Uncharacterized protein n=1 Tax=Bagarius yarrelli TaxID=175774 RepID=A0A556UEP2_BAGYA|nr:hypothetical protein Baya_10046 [Bagarius yarrelli]